MLLGQSPEEVLNHAFEYSMREDILMEMEELELPAPLAAALLESPFPLADIYKDFRDMETGHMNDVRECIEGRAESLLEVRQEVPRSYPMLYPQSGEYAAEHGETEAFRASRQANVACKEAIEAASHAGFDGKHLKAAPKAVLAEFGQERVTYVLAATIQRKDWDARFSRENKAWAAAVPMFEREDRRSAYIVHIHPGLVNLFVDTVRKELDTVREQPEQTAKKPSIKEQLTAKSVPGDKSPKPKDREAR